jgi:hypothetical protein
MKVTWTGDDTAIATMKVRIAFVEGGACSACMANGHLSLCDALIRNCSATTRHDKKAGNFQIVKE